MTDKERKRKYVYTRHNNTIVIQATIEEMPDCICTDGENSIVWVLKLQQNYVLFQEKET